MGSDRKCASCGKAVAPRAVNRAFPFCSDRCRLLDLGKWLDERYRIPAGLPGDGAATASAPESEDES